MAGRCLRAGRRSGVGAALAADRHRHWPALGTDGRAGREHRGARPRGHGHGHLQHRAHLGGRRGPGRGGRRAGGAGGGKAWRAVARCRPAARNGRAAGPGRSGACRPGAAGAGRLACAGVRRGLPRSVAAAGGAGGGHGAGGAVAAGAQGPGRVFPGATGPAGRVQAQLAGCSCMPRRENRICRPSPCRRCITMPPSRCR